MNYQEAVKYILDIPKFGKKGTHENRQILLDKLGDPYRTIKVIHVAGTNGKGSVCAFIASILKTGNKKVGLFTSPHLVKINERFKINGESVSDALFYEAYRQVRDLCDALVAEGLEHPSYFEFLFLMSAYIFKSQEVEYAVLETGLGGRLDATNIVQSPILTIITTIGYDHTEVLGDTLEQIASEKAGIIKEGCPVVCLWQNESVFNVIKEVSSVKKAPLYVVKDLDYEILKINHKTIDFYINSRYYEYKRITIPFISQYQIINLAIALTGIFVMQQEVAFLTDAIVCEGVRCTQWAGRMESLTSQIILDGAHNQQGIDAFTETVSGLYQGKKIKLLYACLKDKDYHHMIHTLCKKINIDEVILTEVNSERRATIESLETVFKQNGVVTIQSFKEIDKAFSYGRSRLDEESILFCLGSLYLIGSIKEIWDK